jgi:hypothetical protein
MSQFVTRPIFALLIASLLLGLLEGKTSVASAETVQSFATASVDSKGTALGAYSAGQQLNSSSLTDQLVGISTDASSSLWIATLTPTTSLGLIFRTKSGAATLFPKTLIDPQKSLFPTPNGIVIQQGNKFSYLSAEAAIAGTNPVSVGTIPAVGAGYFRDVSSITALDNAVYVATIDYQIAATDPTLGLSHLWYLAADSAVDTYNASSQYVTSLEISPSDSTKFAALLVRIGNRNTFFGQVTGSISNNKTLTFDNLPTWMAANPGMIDQNLGWILQDSQYIPAVVDVLSSNTIVHTFAGNALALYPAKTSIVLAPTLASFDTSTAIRNKIQRTITVNPVLDAVLPYNTVLKNVGLLTSSSLGYTDAVGIPLFITLGTKTTPLVPKQIVRSNFCLSASITESGPLAAATGSFCSKVQAQLKVTVKKRVLTILTSSKKLIVQTIVKRKWVPAKLKIKLIKGKATVAAQKGVYKFSVAETALNAAISTPILIVK